MIRTFKETSNFRKKWSALGLTDDDLRVLQLVLLKIPRQGIRLVVQEDIVR